MKRWVAACLFLGLFAAAGCSEDNDPIEQLDEASDCNEICETYQMCFDEDYDVDACQDECTDRADDPDHRDQEEECSNCIDEASCTGAAFSCATDCIGIVP
jgi:hypothetical protein